MPAIDIAALAILSIAALRGFLLGLIREIFSLAALAGACIAVRAFYSPVTVWLESFSGGSVRGTAALIVAGAAIAVGVILVIAIVGRIVRRGARAAGLGAADRLAGAGLGAAEGAVVIALLMLLAVSILGRNDPLLSNSRALAVFERVEHLLLEHRGTVEETATTR